MKYQGRVFISQEKSFYLRPGRLSLEKIFGKILSILKKKSTDIEIRFVSSATMTKLNARYRGKKKTTDVLSFASRTEGLLGSLVIDVTTAREQARFYRQSLSREVQELFIHGVLHLHGFDHERHQDAEIMRELELKILAWLNKQTQT